MSVSEHQPAGRPTAGIDWASDSHAVAIAAGGVELARFEVAYTSAGLRQLLRRRGLDGPGEAVEPEPEAPVD